MRTHMLTRKVKTVFGSMYVHVELNHLGQPVGGQISTPGKEPESQISILLRQLSEGFDDVLAIGRDDRVRDGGPAGGGAAA